MGPEHVDRSDVQGAVQLVRRLYLPGRAVRSYVAVAAGGSYRERRTAAETQQDLIS